MKSPPLSLELVPMDGAPAPSPESTPPPALGTPEVIEVQSVDKAPHAELHGAVPDADRFAREAAQQYAEGHIDQPLWDRALAQSNGDQEAAVARYLKARATALRLLDRELRQEQRARLRGSEQRAPNGAPKAPAPDPGFVESDEDEMAPSAVRSARFDQKRLLGKYRTALIVVGIAVPVLAVGGWLMFGRSEPPPPPVAARPAAKAPKAADAAPAKAAAPDPNAVTAEFRQKLQQFRDTGNWNMVVLYAVEWTRREPANAQAWAELRAGYVYLRQYDDALAAARKAVELAPTDAAMWRHLGNAHLDVDDPAKALTAFNEAVTRDPTDVYSMQQIGLLNARAGRMPEAKAAFDLALVAQPADPLTVCLKNGVAQLPAQKDAYAATLQVRAVDAKCHGTELPAEPTAPPAAAAQRPGAAPATPAAPKRAAQR